MGARLLLAQDDIDRNRDRWKQLRRKGVTASEIAVILGIAPKTHGSAFSLFTEKQSGEDRIVDNEQVRRGNLLEPYVSSVFEEEHPYLVLYDGGLYCSSERPWQMATFDRLAVDAPKLGLSVAEVQEYPFATDYGMPVQIKTWATRDGWGEERTADIPVHIRAQCLYEMDVRGADTVWVPVLFMQDWVVATYIIERTDAVNEDIAIMRHEAAAFLDRLDRDDPPPVDWLPATTDALKTLHPVLITGPPAVPNKKLANRYKAALRAKERATQRLELAKNEMRASMGAAAYAALIDKDGKEHKVCGRSQYEMETIDSKLLRKRYPAIAKEVTRKTPIDKLVAGGWTKED